MDADLSHPPDRLTSLIAALSDADVAVGSRYVQDGAINAWTWLRRLISAWGNLFARIVLGLSVCDVTAGYKAFRRSALLTLDVMNSLSDGYCFQIENAWRAERLGLRVAEVPITFTDRTRGSSKMSRRIVIEALTRVVFWRARELAVARGAEVSAFLAVGAAGYVVDVGAFNALRGLDPFRLMDPTVARTLAMLLAMCVTYFGHRLLTWRQHRGSTGGRELGLFVVLNLIGLAISDACLVISHDLLGLTSLLADNISANVIGLGLGSIFRFLTYRRFVFTPRADEVAAVTVAS